MSDGHYHLRRLDDPTNASGTLLTLPLSDFPIVGSSAARSGAVVSPRESSAGHDACEDGFSDDDEGGLILMNLPPGIISIDDLITSNVYILGPNVDIDDRAEGGTNNANPNSNDGGNSFEPVSARLIIEDKLGKTLILTRVETSNTYIVVPPMKVDAMTMVTNDDDKGIHAEGGNRKKRKLLSSSSSGDEIDNVNGTTSKQILVTMSARSVGQIPGESSPATFFLEPTLLPPRHFANVLREILCRATYDPFDPPPTTTTTTTTKKLGYTIPELARLCRTSHAEVSNAIHGRYFGAEDALVLPSCSSGSLRYGTLSEEGRRTVYSAIVSTVVESDTELQWLSSGGVEGDGMPLPSFVDEIRDRWARSEGGTSSSSMSFEQYHLPDEIIWSCLRPIFVGVNNANDKPTPGDNDCGTPMPQLGWLDPDGVAKLVVHEVFLRGGVRTPRGSGGNMTWWKEDELVDAWSMRLPTIPGGYAPNVGLLRGIAICEMMTSSSTATTMPWDNDKTEEGVDACKTNNRRWRYFPEAFGLHPSDPVLRIQRLFTMRDAWTVKEAMPYLEKLLVEYGVGGKEFSVAMVDLLLRHARATITNIEETSVTRYIAKL